MLFVPAIQARGGPPEPAGTAPRSENENMRIDKAKQILYILQAKCRYFCGGNGETMPRNVEKDTREEAKRRKNILEAGLKLFSEYGIESVSMNSVAEATGIGPTTLFKYYKNKENLVVAISGLVWKNIWQNSLTKHGEERFKSFTACEMIEIFTSDLIEIYQNRPELLKFSSNCKTFVCRNNVPFEELRDHLEPLKPIREIFHDAFLRSKTGPHPLLLLNSNPAQQKRLSADKQ